MLKFTHLIPPTLEYCLNDWYVLVHPCDKTPKGGCDHICTRIDEEFICECNENYKLNKDGKTCDIGKFIYDL